MLGVSGNPFARLSDGHLPGQGRILLSRTALMKPAFILVRPQLGENIGMVARAMWNFGLDDLRLVAPRDGWPNPAAGPAASGADRLLDEARVFPDLPSAIADCHRVYATTVRPRGMMKETVTARFAAVQSHELDAQGLRAAYLFGPERAGLETEDVAHADQILTIPVNPDFSSLNLAQAAVLCAYEWFQHVDETPDAILGGDHGGPASREALDGLVGHLDAELTARNYFRPSHRAAVMRQTLRGMLQRPGFTEQEVRTLRGVVRALCQLPNGIALPRRSRD